MTFNTSRKIRYSRFILATVLLAVLVLESLPLGLHAQTAPTITAGPNAGTLENDANGPYYRISPPTEFSVVSKLNNSTSWCTNPGYKIFWGVGKIRQDIRRFPSSAVTDIQGGEDSIFVSGKFPADNPGVYNSFPVVYYCYNRKLTNPFTEINQVNPRPNYVLSTVAPNFPTVVLFGSAQTQTITIDPRKVRAVYNTQYTIFQVRQKDDISFNVEVKLDPNSKDIAGSPYAELKKGDKTPAEGTITGFYVQFDGEPKTKTSPLVEKLSTTQPQAFTIKFTKDLRNTIGKNEIGKIYEFEIVPYLQTDAPQSFQMDRIIGSNPIVIKLTIVADNVNPDPPGGGSGTGGTPTTPDGNLGGLLLTVVNIILGIIIGILRWVIWFLGTVIFVPLLGHILNLDASQIAGGFVLTGWLYVRDIVNMFFILILIVIGFGTMLRIEAYNYKKLLVNLIVMALLVNFSLVIGRIIMQIADAVQFTFLPADEGVDAVNELFKDLSTVHTLSILDGLRNLTLSGGAALATTFALIFQFILEFAVILTFGALAIFLLIRVVALYILLILSPVAYALHILPVTSSLAKKWWSNFIKYVFFAPLIAFFLKLTNELYRNGLGIFSETMKWNDRGDLISKIKDLDKTAGLDFEKALGLGLVYVVVIAFLWAGMIVTKNMGIFGAAAIVGLAERGMKAPFALAGKGLWAGTKALTNLGAEKILEHTGVETRVGKWIEGWKKSREVSREAREARGAAIALEKKSALASPVTFFQRYWHPEGIRRVWAGGEKKGRKLLEQGRQLRAEANQKQGQAKLNQAESLKKQADQLLNEAAQQPKTSSGAAIAKQKRQIANSIEKQVEKLVKEAAALDKAYAPQAKEKLKQARILENQGKKLIAPDDYFTQQKFRSAVDEELKTIHTDNWHELVDLFESAEREKKPIRAAAILQHLTDTYNENELINSSQYTRNMSAQESADGKEHQAEEFFEYSAGGAENFRKLILEEKLGLGSEASMMIMSDVSDMAEKRNHFEIMRMYISEHGKLRRKRPDEREPEVSAEMDKMSTGKVLSEANRLVGSREVPDKDYDVTGHRTTHIEPTLVAYYLKNYSAVRFLLNRGQMNPSQAKAVAEPQNQAILRKAAELLDDTEIVEKIAGVSEILTNKGLKDTRRQQYLEIMNQLINYGATKGVGATGKSRIEEVQDLFARSK